MVTEFVRFSYYSVFLLSKIKKNQKRLKILFRTTDSNDIEVKNKKYTKKRGDLHAYRSI